ncbi:GNAT family N-acetyltransferase [Streptomyces shenzhenensis]|uniref:GNAT family N-acetyltransferase n=1 Tax=Streptomyces shenzhenensis TaxID=943815 RepID=UPI0037F9BCBE
MSKIDTARLILRRWHDNDLEPLAAINADPDVMRWIGDGSTRDEVQTRAGLEAMERQWEADGFGLFAVEVRSTGELAGFTGLSVPEYLPEVMPTVEVGWRLGRRFWGVGIASEAAAAVVRFGFRDCGLEQLVSVTQVGNGASERIMEKLGMRLVRESVDPSCGRPIHIYATTRAQHAAAEHTSGS